MRSCDALRSTVRRRDGASSRGTDCGTGACDGRMSAQTEATKVATKRAPSSAPHALCGMASGRNVAFMTYLHSQLSNSALHVICSGGSPSQSSIESVDNALLEVLEVLEAGLARNNIGRSWVLQHQVIATNLRSLGQPALTFEEHLS